VALSTAGAGSAVVPGATGRSVAGESTTELALRPSESPDGGPAAVPVRLELTGDHAASVRGWVEGVLGWQPVDEATDELVPPAVRFVDAAEAATRPGRRSIPTVLLVADDAAAGAAATLAQVVAPDLVVAWPSGRDRLADAVAALLARPATTAGDLRTLRVGGAAGGVGTTTVALVLGGLVGWSDRRCVTVLRPPAPVPDLRVVPVDAVGATELWSRSTPLPGVPATRVIGVVGGGAPAPSDPHLEVAVVDAGVDDDVDVLVCRPDAAALERLTTTTAAAVVVVGDGPASPGDLARAAGGRHGIRLPWSARVARAALLGRVPGALPGRFVQRLQPIAGHAAGP
jgi:hypothetical protein